MPDRETAAGPHKSQGKRRWWSAASDASGKRLKMEPVHQASGARVTLAGAVSISGGGDGSQVAVG